MDRNPGEELSAQTGNHAGVPNQEAGVVRLVRPAADVLGPQDAGYDEARQVYNGRVNRRPAEIVFCTSLSDIVTTIRYARELDVPLAIRGGGHSSAGFGVCDGGVVADLRRLNRVHVDLARKTVRVAGGCTWGDVDAATTASGLAAIGCRISSVGVGGSTLGGGYGWLMRRYGLAIDNLLSAEVVLADGTVVRADPLHDDDLFWALRGGGGNFGVVSEFEFRLHEIPPAVTGGMVFYTADRAADVIGTYRMLTSAACDELSAQCNVLLAPPAPFVPDGLRGRPIVAVAVCHLGTPANAERDLAPLRTLGPAVDRIRPMPYAKLQRMFDAAGVFGRCAFGRSGHLSAMSDEVVDAVLAHALHITSPFSIAMISQLGGAVGRVDEHATAFSCRDAAFDYAIDAVWTDEDGSSRHMHWVERFWSSLRPFTTGVYVNELGDDGASRLREAYRPSTYARLADLKRRFDPDNVFRMNHNIDISTPQEAGRC